VNSERAHLIKQTSIGPQSSAVRGGQATDFTTRDYNICHVLTVTDACTNGKTILENRI